MKKPSKTQVVRVGVIGIGAMGGHHARTILAGEVPGLKLTAVCDLDAEKLGKFPEVAGFTKHRELLKSSLVDAVIIATPHFSHTTIGIDAIEAGLHVLVEKPVAVQIADGEKLIKAHKGKKTVFAAMFNQRTDPNYQKIREMVQGGELGRIRRVVWTITNWFRSQAYYNSCNWRATWAGEGGGVLINQCVHNIDLLQWIFGMPSSIRAVCHVGRYHAIEVEDDVSAIMEFEGDATGVLITSTGEAPGTNRLEVSGERGRLVHEGTHLMFFRNEIDATEYSRQTVEGYKPPPCWQVEIDLPGGRGEQHTGILKNFAGAILRGEPLIAPASEGLKSLEILNAIMLSGFEDETVQMPLSRKQYAAFLRKKIASSNGKKRVVPYHGSKANYLTKK